MNSFYTNCHFLLKNLRENREISFFDFSSVTESVTMNREFDLLLCFTIGGKS